MAKIDFKIEWIDSGREPTQIPDPRYPQGIDLDVTDGAIVNCVVLLPYPARRCGIYYIECKRCGVNGIVTTAGRPDDPRSICMPCKIKYNS